MLKALYLQTFNRCHGTEIIRNGALVKGENLLCKNLQHLINVAQKSKLRFIQYRKNPLNLEPTGQPLPEVTVSLSI